MQAFRGSRRAAAAAAAALLLILLAAAPHGSRAAGAVPVHYCPDGRSLETGLCYPRCPMGSVGLGCSCWREGTATWRGCGVPPRSCEARSFRRPALPPPLPADRAGFTLLMSADPQLFRNYTRYDDRRGAEAINRRLVQSINSVRDLKTWPADAGGGAVAEPRAMAVLGDLTEFYMERQQDAFRHFYDPSFPRAIEKDRVRFPTWLMLGNHDYVNNVGHCSEKTVDNDFCAKWAVNMMRAALAPSCPASHWTGLPKSNVTSFDAGSMAYAFDYGRYHFVVLHHSPRYDRPEIGVAESMPWLARELAHATAQQRRIVLLLHAHKELHLTRDPTFAALLESSNVVAVFFGHIHIRPWGLVGRYPNTTVPMFNCGASWYHVYCLTEFQEDAFRVGVVAHYGDGRPTWFGSSVHSLPRGQRGKPVLEAFVPNPNVTTWWRPDNTSAASMAAAQAAAAAEAAEEAEASMAASGRGFSSSSDGGNDDGTDAEGGGPWKIHGRRLKGQKRQRGPPSEAAAAAAADVQPRSWWRRLPGARR